MRIINKDELKHEKKLLQELKKSIFIYPTDTIYGIGCDATNEALVAKIREIKQTPTQPFSIIIPNKNLVFEHCETNENTRENMNKLPGPYTLILKVKKKFFANNVAPGIDTIGIRIPNHWFYNYVKKMKVSIITTSANVSGGEFMTNLEDLDSEVKKRVDYIVYDGEIRGRPSTIINLVEKEVKVIDRSKPSVKEKFRKIKRIIKNHTPIKALRRLRSKKE